MRTTCTTTDGRRLSIVTGPDKIPTIVEEPAYPEFVHELRDGYHPTDHCVPCRATRAIAIESPRVAGGAR